MATMVKRWPGRTDPHVVWDHYDDYAGELAFDVGANIGQVAKLIAPRFERVVSFEPCAESYAILAAEAPANVTALPWAVSDTDGPITLYEAHESIQTGQLVSGEGLYWGPIEGERRVEAFTLDSLAAIHGTPDFIKVDTEGHELQVLSGARATLASRPTLLIEVHHAEAGKAILAILGDIGGYDVSTICHEGRPESLAVENHWWIKARAT